MYSDGKGGSVLCRGRMPSVGGCSSPTFNGWNLLERAARPNKVSLFQQPYIYLWGLLKNRSSSPTTSPALFFDSWLPWLE